MSRKGDFAGELVVWILLGLLGLGFYGGYKLFQEFRIPGDCRHYAERWCYLYPGAGTPPMTYQECVERVSKGYDAAWCREALKDLEK